MNEILILAIIFFIVATVYSSAGFGGGSSYLAVLSFFPLVFTDIRMTALICNIVVVGSSVILFYKHQLINWKKLLPLIIASVPLAYLGGQLLISERVFFIILGISLLFASLAMIFDKGQETFKLPKYFNGVIGGAIGFLSGLVGIGGGIFLSPILHLSRWSKPKVIAASSAVFILFNSISGILGQYVSYGFNLELNKILVLIFAVFLGSQIGVRLTIFKFKPMFVRRTTAVVIFIVSLRILFKYL